MDDEVGTPGTPKRSDAGVGTPNDQMPVWIRRLLGQTVYVVVALVVVVGGFLFIKARGEDSQREADRQVECNVHGRNC